MGQGRLSTHTETFLLPYRYKEYKLTCTFSFQDIDTLVLTNEKQDNNTSTRLWREMRTVTRRIIQNGPYVHLPLATKIMLTYLKYHD